MAHLHKLRTVGRLEQYSTSRGHLGLYNNVGISSIYHCPKLELRGSTVLLEALKQPLYHALARVIEQHPILAAVPLDVRSPTPYLARLPQIDLHRAVKFVAVDYEDPSTLDGLLEIQHNQPFELDEADPQPFWRLFILTKDEFVPGNGWAGEFMLCFIFHHAIGDGAAGVTFHKTLVTHLAAETRELAFANRPERPTLVEIAQGIKLLPSLEELAITGSVLLSELGRTDKSLAPTTSPTKPSQPLPDNIWSARATSLPVITNLTTVFISSKTTSALTALCRVNNTSITAALQTLTASMLFSILSPTCTHMRSSVPISLRPWLRPLLAPTISSTERTNFTKATGSTDFMGCYVTATSLTHARGAFTWAEARRVKEVLKATVAMDLKGLVGTSFESTENETKSQSESVTALKRGKTSAFDARLLAQLGRERDAAFEVSNLGVVAANMSRPVGRPVSMSMGEGAGDVTTVAQKAEWSLGRIIFSQSASGIGPAIKIGVVSGTTGEMGLSFVWQDGVVSKEMVEKLVNGLREGLVGLVEE